VKFVFDYTKVPLEDTWPEGWHRARTEKVALYPQDAEIDENMQILGMLDEDGEAKYAYLRVHFKFEEHESNVSEEAVLAGETVSDMWSFSRKRFVARSMRELFEATAFPFDADGGDTDAFDTHMKGSLVDIYIQNEPDNRNKTKKQARIRGIRAALD
jgi:hypothetical protein